MKKLIFFSLMIACSFCLNAQQSCYQGLLDVAMKQYNRGKYEEAIKNLSTAKKICSDANMQVLDEWINKSNKKISERDNRDSDGDGIPDKNDKCPYDYSTTDEGCPPKPFTGFAKKTYNEGTYEGDFRDGKFSGKGKYKWKNGDEYSGNWKEGLMDGVDGLYTWSGGVVYNGDYKNGQQNGKGKLFFPNGDKYSGEFKDDKKNGAGTYTWNNNLEYNGTWLNDFMDGQGTMIVVNSSSPDIVNCQFCRKYIGGFKSGLKQGNGKCFDANDKIIYEGQFSSDQPVEGYPSKKYHNSMLESQILKETGIEMKFIQGGTFDMGNNEEYSSQPVHKVTVTDFYIGKFEVTQSQWIKIMGGNLNDNNHDWAVTNITWEDTQNFIKKLNEKTGKKFRLPTEAEWEYAAKGGENYRWSGSNDVKEVAVLGYLNYKTGTKKPNGFGLYDMSGNVGEWCSDYYSYSYYKNGPSLNPENKVPDKSKYVKGEKVCRGALGNSESYATVYARISFKKDEFRSWIGCRLALDSE